MVYIEKQRELEIKGEYDVIVCGSGPAGIGAAVTAGRNGAKTLLLEQNGTVGGVATSGLMSHFTGDCNSKIYKEVLKRQADNRIFQKGEITPTIDPDVLMNVYFDMLKEANVDILLYTFVCDTITEDDTLKGVIVENKSGRSVYLSKVIIDATGDGDVAYKSGAEFFKGRENDEKMQPATIMFKLGGVDYDRAVFPPSFETEVPTEKGELQSLARKILPYPAGHVLLYQSTLPGIVTVNMTNCTDVDATKAEDWTRATIVCRSQLSKIVEFLREYAPGYENCYIVSSAPFLGIRETRHFKGLYSLTENDILEAKVFDDYVVKDAHFNFDIHNIDGSGLDKNGSQKNFIQNKGYTIPYRCLVPEKIDGLLLSGRNISGTHIAHSNFRAMPICMGIGEAAGAAAALATKKGCNLREVSAKEIRDLIM